MMPPCTGKKRGGVIVVTMTTGQEGRATCAVLQVACFVRDVDSSLTWSLNPHRLCRNQSHSSLIMMRKTRN